MAKKKKQRIEVQWWPQPRQLTFLRVGLSHPFDGGEPGRPVADVIGYGGSAGGGKSDSLLLAGIIAGLTWPGINVGYFRREYPQLEGPGGAIMRSQEIMSGWAKWNGTQRRWTLPTGSILQFAIARRGGCIQLPVPAVDIPYSMGDTVSASRYATLSPGTAPQARHSAVYRCGDKPRRYRTQLVQEGVYRFWRCRAAGRSRDRARAVRKHIFIPKQPTIRYSKARP